MEAYLVIAGMVLLANAATGILVTNREQSEPERLIVILFVGTTTVAAILLFGTAASVEGTIDIALIAALFSPFVPLTFTRRLLWDGRRRTRHPKRSAES